MCPLTTAEALINISRGTRNLGGPQLKGFISNSPKFFDSSSAPGKHSIHGGHIPAKDKHMCLATSPLEQLNIPKLLSR